MTEQQPQPAQDISDTTTTTNTVNASEDLLQQALSMFDMQSVTPVQAAFPQVISGDKPLQAVTSTAQHEVWLQSLAAASSAGSSTQTSAEQDPLQAIRAMYGE